MTETIAVTSFTLLVDKVRSAVRHFFLPSSNLPFWGGHARCQSTRSKSFLYFLWGAQWNSCEAYAFHAQETCLAAAIYLKVDQLLSHFPDVNFVVLRAEFLFCLLEATLATSKLISPFNFLLLFFRDAAWRQFSRREVNSLLWDIIVPTARCCENK